MNYHRYGHLLKAEVKLGQKIKRGEKIGELGTTGNSTSGHLHYDIMLFEPKTFKEYIIGRTKEWVQTNYKKPEINSEIPTKFTHLGWGWLEEANYSGKKAFHSGLDINGGSGNSDVGNPVYSVCDGEVVYVNSDGSYNDGWGNMIVIKEQESLEMEIVKSKVDELENEKLDLERKIREKDEMMELYKRNSIKELPPQFETKKALMYTAENFVMIEAFLISIEKYFNVEVDNVAQREFLAVSMAFFPQLAKLAKIIYSRFKV